MTNFPDLDAMDDDDWDKVYCVRQDFWVGKD